MPDDTDIILPAKVARAIEHFVDTRDADKAAMLANLEPDVFRRWMRKRAVRNQINHKIDLVDQACAELRARARVLTVDKLDSSLVDILDSKDKKATFGARIKAIELGYKRHGALTEKMEHSGKDGAPLTFQLVRIGAKKDEGGDGGAPATAA
jgi:hypothetical protein